MPIIGFLSALFIPLPTLFYRSKLGRINGAVVPILTFILMVAALGRISIDTLFFIELLFLGYILSEFIELKLSIEKTMLYACGSVIITGAVSIFIYSNIYDIPIYSLVTEYVKKNLELTLALYENMDVSQESIHKISNSFENIQYVLVRIIPALVVSTTFFISWTNLLLAKPLLKVEDSFILHLAL